MKSNRRKEEQKDKRVRKQESMEHPSGRSTYARKIIAGKAMYSQKTKHQVMHNK